MQINPMVNSNVPIAIILRDPVESKILPKTGAATVLAPKLELTLNLHAGHLNPLKELLKMV